MGDSVTSSNLAATGVYSKYNTKAIDTSDDSRSSSYMNFSDYLEVLAAQMSNQDFNDPMSDSEFLQQMASYSMLESINAMTKQTNISYASSLVGKAVTVLSNGVYDTGIVESAAFSGDKYYIVINGNSYETSAVSDITDTDTYNKLASLIGKTVTVDNSGTDVTGKVTDIIVTGGNAFAVIDSKDAYLVSKIKKVENSSSDTDNVTNEADNAASETSNTSSYLNSLSLNEELGALQAKSAAIYNELWASLDAVASQDDDSISAQSNGTGLSNRSGALYSGSFNGEAQGVVTADGVDYAALLNSDSDDFTSITDNINTADILAGATANFNVIKATLSNANGTDSSSNTENSQQTSNFGSTRRYADIYPEEAALADQLGTRMVSIGFIHNNAITSRIDTSEILGYTASGKAFTEIGYSGKGRLGEVVTWADGTQRVEIINPDGTSGYFTTSGKYTLDEICDFNCAPGSLAGKLTPFESAIRHYSREYTDEEKAYLKSFSNYISSLYK
jgi:flagellar basal-body rod modification protein FlgD